MNYRPLGNTGIQVSEIALGCEGFLNKTQEETDQFIQYSLDHGVNCIDLYSPNPEMHQRIGSSVKRLCGRDKFVYQAHLCTRWRNGQYEVTRNLNEVKENFEAMLRNLGTDYVDVGMIHYVDSDETWQNLIDNGILDYVCQLKAEGKVKHTGLSSHNPLVALKAIESGKIEVLMFSVNPCYDLLPGNEDVELLWADESYKGHLTNLDPDRERLYETCQRKGVGITVMKAFGGGDLVTSDSPAGVALTPVQCLHYALTRPAVSCIMSGIRSMEDLEKSLAYETATEEEKDYASAFARFPKISWEGHCMYCGHCAPCPKGIAVADVTKFLNLTKAQKMVPETVREHYVALKAHGGDCIECGACEKRCPFKVAIRENMKEAAKVFGY